MRGAEASVLRDQLVRAAMSVPTNIVEGCAHTSPRELARYLRYALASASEVEGHAQLARDLNYLSEPNFKELLGLVVEVRMMLHGLLKKLEKD
jgi:four helix bundle protein